MATVESPSNVLTYFSKLLGVREAEITFLICQFTAFFYSYLFRWYLNPRKVSATTRHISQVLLGILMACVSFGWGIFHILIGAGVSLLMIFTIDPKVVQYYVFAFAMIHLSWVHLYMQVRNAGVGNLDYIGPMMILTVKTSSLAFSIHDGFTKDESKLNSLQKQLVVRRYPRFLEFWSYIFSPQGLLVGPICYFSNYVDFIQGNNFIRKVKNESGEERIVYEEPSSMRAVTMKSLFALFCAVILMTTVPKVPIMGNISAEVLKSSSILYRLGYLLVSVEVAKSKYFFGWMWADAICNAAGLGFAGYDENGRPDWSGVQNVDVIGFQTATSLKTLIDSWNITCAMWLKYVCFDRVPSHKRFLTFVLSAFWHGFYPGYFATFISGSLMVSAAAKVRYVVRPFFLSSSKMKLFYDVITWLCTYVTLAYIITPFTYLRLQPTLQFFNSYYWFLHVLAALVLLVFPSRRRSSHQPETIQKTNQNGFSVSDCQNYIQDSGATTCSIRDVVCGTETEHGRKGR
ncbi:lysophospholipid acyltransferase 2-like [Acanthaster planci]|uniref:Lysophospholipid acyltransferase 2-like n=1 Tax=Acanthaster planci TaxID=133434 RepID=A0A8B7ZJS2_ACAPL|nr:lysophospholipid acyltransferase 2-like [Acanthaster planci]